MNEKTNVRLALRIPSNDVHAQTVFFLDCLTSIAHLAQTFPSWVNEDTTHKHQVPGKHTVYQVPVLEKDEAIWAKSPPDALDLDVDTCVLAKYAYRCHNGVSFQIRVGFSEKADVILWNQPVPDIIYIEN